MDDGLACNSEAELVLILSKLEEELAKVNLKINYAKCELYCDFPPQIARLSHIPFIQDRTLWTYVGSLIVVQPAQSPSVKSALKKIE